MPMDVRVMDITPELARHLLSQLAPYQRRIDSRHVQGIEADLRAGRWVPNGSPIRFDTEGRLCDGQHRLLACVRSGVTLVDQVVIGDLTEAAYGTIDTNLRTRSALQIARQRHLTVTPTASCIAAAGFEHYNFDSLAYKDKSTPVERVDLWERVSEPLQLATKRLNQVMHANGAVYRAALAAALRCMRTEDRAYEFFHYSFSNDVNGCTSQGRVLFNTLARMRLRKNDPLAELQIAWSCMRAFVATMRGEALQVLRLPSEWPLDARTLPTMAVAYNSRRTIPEPVERSA